MHDRHLVLFDIDGTLLHSGGCGRASTRLAMDEVFGTIGRVDDISFAGKTDWQILREALCPVGVSDATIEAQLDAYMTAVARHLEAIIADFPVRPCAGAPEVVAALRDDPAALVGLLTGNMPSLVPLKLRTAGYDLADFKVSAVGSDGWDRAMLPPLALERARAHAGIDFAPDRIVIIGDTPGDIACAASVGARTIAVATGPYTTGQLRAHSPTHAFESMADVDAFLAAIFENGRAG